MQEGQEIQDKKRLLKAHLSHAAKNDHVSDLGGDSDTGLGNGGLSSQDIRNRVNICKNN
jgi:hypothetical protein